jgi:hypothetical protein
MRAAFSASARIIFLSSQSAVGIAQDPFRPPSQLSHHFDRHHHDPRYSLGCGSLHDLLEMQYSSLEDSNHRRFAFLYQQFLYGSSNSLACRTYLVINFRPSRAAMCSFESCCSSSREIGSPVRHIMIMTCGWHDSDTVLCVGRGII